MDKEQKNEKKKFLNPNNISWNNNKYTQHIFTASCIIELKNKKEENEKKTKTPPPKKNIPSIYVGENCTTNTTSLIKKFKKILNNPPKNRGLKTMLLGHQ